MTGWRDQPHGKRDAQTNAQYTAAQQTMLRHRWFTSKRRLIDFEEKSLQMHNARYTAAQQTMLRHRWFTSKRRLVNFEEKSNFTSTRGQVYLEKRSKRCQAPTITTSCVTSQHNTHVVPAVRPLSETNPNRERHRETVRKPTAAAASLPGGQVVNRWDPAVFEMNLITKWDLRRTAGNLSKLRTN
jgi:hypothetical protein